MADTRYRFHGNAKPVRRSNLAAPVAPQNGIPANAGDSRVAVMRLYDPIDSWGGEWGVSAKEFAAALDELDPQTEEIRLHLNTPGGEVFEAVTMLNALRRHPAKVTAIVDGLAASAGSFLAAGADETIMGKNTQLMIHDAWGLCIGNALDMRNLADLLDQLSNNIADIYAEKAGGTAALWREAMLAETWFSAEEAVTAGLADSIEGSSTSPENAFDLSQFKHAGRDEAPTPLLVEPELVTPAALTPNEVREQSGLDPVDAEPTSISAFQDRRHRMNARRYAAALSE